MVNYQIAIDGPAGSGKSTVAKQIAKKLGFLYVDTGAMYRAVTLKTIREKIPFQNQCPIINLAKNTEIDLTIDEKIGQRVYLDGEDVTLAIRMPDVTNAVSFVSRITGVRVALVKHQQALAANNNVVMEGRDIGSVVLPNAFLKIYLTASIEERARRRFEENKTKGINTDMETLKAEIAERDLIDSTRKESPLIKVADAVEMETDSLTACQVADKIIDIFNERVENGKQD
ncbi:MAG: (d)CMP kinase [Abditibacteriota bacterium]|nr:(d)CMP kinase [Abditibacteriota bacterium]